MSVLADISDYLDSMAKRVIDVLPIDIVRMSRGKIIAVDTVGKTVTVTIGGGEMAIPEVNYFAHYTPTVGDQVHLLKVGQDSMVFGMIKRP